MMRLSILVLSSLLLLRGAATAEDTLEPADVFELEWASDPQISPDGSRVVYVRNFMDIMTDRRRSNLWIVDAKGRDHRPLTTGNENDASPRWSPDGSRLAYVSSSDGSTQLYLRWMDTGITAKLTNLTHPPRGLTWSPSGDALAFSMFVPQETVPFVKMPRKPEGAEWAAPARVIQKLQYRADGEGYLEDGYDHLFVVPAEGGTPYQLTDGDFHDRGGFSWAPDGAAIVFSANRHENWELDPLDTELYEVSLDDRTLRALTSRKGPDNAPAISPDGERIAFTGFDDEVQGYQVQKLYVMKRDGSEPSELTFDLDRDVTAPRWTSDGRGLYFQYDDRGDRRVGFVPLDGKVQTVATSVGGTSIGRPYSSGSFSVSDNGVFAFTLGRSDRPADVAVQGPREEAHVVTALNEDLLGHKKLGEVEAIEYESTYDRQPIQGFIVKPPDFDGTRKYPLILEIHGGPFASYGPSFSSEIQLYAAAGYVVVYLNPRGSTSYGEAFGNLIHHAYPGHDFDDLMSGVDAVLERGYVDENRLFVTGGSGGGVLTSWIVGKTDRFRAAAVAKPVINWYSFVLTSDGYPFFTKYWFPGPPWEHERHYMSRSPISLVGNVTTPTMLLNGEEDYRTPISEAEQYYQALKLRKVPTALVRLPGASHGIVKRPSQLIAKVAHILKWFEIYDEETGR